MYVTNKYSQSKYFTLYKQTCQLAIDEGWAVNLGGGFGYSNTRISKGLAVYDDIPVCLAVSYSHSKLLYVVNLYACMHTYVYVCSTRYHYFVYLGIINHL